MFVLQEAVILSVTSKFLANVNLLSKLRLVTGNINPTKYIDSRERVPLNYLKFPRASIGHHRKSLFFIIFLVHNFNTAPIKRFQKNRWMLYHYIQRLHLQKIMVMIIVLYKFDSQYHVSGTLGTG